MVEVFILKRLEAGGGKNICINQGAGPGMLNEGSKEKKGCSQNSEC